MHRGDGRVTFLRPAVLCIVCCLPIQFAAYGETWPSLFVHSKLY